MVPKKTTAIQISMNKDKAHKDQLINTESDITVIFAELSTRYIKINPIT